MVFYAYFGYPVSLVIIGKFKSRETVRNYITPDVTLIITAFNEEKRIRDKLENSIALEYSSDKLQILVASDGSTDRTNDIVREYESRGVELFEVVERGGKENAQKEAIPHARGDIIVFSDVATILEPGGLKEIVSNFADKSVGCVSSEDRLMGQDGRPSGEGAYVRYEMWLRRLESKVNSLVGLSGSFFAARKEVCQDFSGDVQSDFRTLLSSMKIGLRGVSDPKAVGWYLDIADEGREFERKVRTVLRGLTVFFRHIEFLNIFKYKLFSFQFFCHKLLRWLVPFFLIAAFVANLILCFSSFVYIILFFGQVLFYGVGIFGMLQKASFEFLVFNFELRKNPFLKIPMYFVVVNAAVAVAWWQYLTGKRVVLWTPSER